MGKSVLREKSYRFAIRIISLARLLQEGKKEFILSKQLLRSGTSIGAMMSEAEYAESRADFAHKLSIALKEASETRYWIQLLDDSGYIADEGLLKGLHSDCGELIAMLIATVKKVKK